MSVLQYQDAMDTPDLQIWNNAAFDNGESEDSAAIKVSWSAVQPLFVNGSESFQSDFSKENLSPVMVRSPVSVKASLPFKPLHPNGAIGNSQRKPSNLLKKGILEPSSPPESRNLKKEDDGVSIDAEIEELEKEISRLSSRLESLKLQKEKQSSKIILPKLNRRGVSLGPSEIIAGIKPRPFGKPQLTPVQSIQNRRKSCFWKLEEIDELKVTKERRMSMSVNQSRKTVSKIQVPKQPATTVGTKRPVKKEDSIISSIQPKKLFNEGEKSVAGKKPSRAGRVVASRYNGNSVVSDVRKRSLPEDDKEEDGKRDDKRRNSTIGKSRNNGTDSSRVKKRWEIPNEVIFYKGVVEEDDTPRTGGGAVSMDVLPKIRTLRCVNESPRDSGGAKRVAELIRKRSYFCVDEEIESPFCQALSFVEENDEQE